jgi:16S rRNA (guanine966-N2)-methyltransferase
MRITGGVLRSRSLSAPRGDSTRPTSDRVREALFAILGSSGDLRGTRVLDLYAGTGALAFEALSRGALRATLVETSRAAIQAIDGNARSLHLATQVRVVRTKVEGALHALSLAGPFDLVFADPPYVQVTTGEAPRALSLLAGSGVFAAEARIVLEHGKSDVPPDIAGLVLLDTRRYGDTALSFYSVASPST